MLFNVFLVRFQPKDNCYHRFGNRDPVKAGEKYEPDDILVGGVGAMSVYELGNPPPLSCGEISADIEEENEMVVGALGMSNGEGGATPQILVVSRGFGEDILKGEKLKERNNHFS